MMNTPGKKRLVLSFRKRLLFVASILVVCGCLVVLIGEAAFRLRRVALTARIQSALGDSGSEQGWAIFDEELHYRNRPDWNDHNAHGMRDDPLASKDRFRILLLGDSIGYQGDSVRDTYPAQLETLLNKEGSLTKSEIVNTSTKGYTNYQQLVYLKKYGFNFEPDAVGVAFCVNDLHTFLHQFDVVDGEIVANTYAFLPDAGNSSTLTILQPSLFLTWMWHKGRAASTRIGLRSGTIFECRPDISTAWDDRPWKALKSQLAEMALLCKEGQLPLFLIAFPHAEQYRQEYLDRDREYVLKPQIILKRYCQELGVVYLDLYASLDKWHFKPDGIHLTNEGRVVAAQAIDEFLRKSGLIPKKGDETTI